MENSAKTMEKIIALAKGRGFVHPGSEIYGGLANTWDYGILGVELKNNIKKAWWQKFVQESPTNVGVDQFIYDKRTENGVDILFHDIFTNGIVYLTFVFDLKNLDAELGFSLLV